MCATRNQHILVLTIGYGEGHRAAARGLGAHWEARGHSCCVADVLAQSDASTLYEWTRLYYQLCVRYIPFLWSLTYDQTETTDWAVMVRSAMFRPILRALKGLIEKQSPELIICTYPLYGYLLDYLREKDGIEIPYLMLVTDSIAISRPWMCSDANAWCVLDSYSRDLVIDRYALDEASVCAAALPVLPSFAPSISSSPTKESCRVLYSAYAPLDRVSDELLALLSSYPEMRITVLAGKKYKLLSAWVSALPKDRRRRMQIEECRSDMDELFRTHDIYVGKAGAATLFEAYQSACPVIMNFALPGQEQGNLELLQREGLGLVAEGGRELCMEVGRLLADGARLHAEIKQRMMQSCCRNGADTLIDFIEKRFFANG